MDKYSAQQRHNMMAGVHGKDTKPEITVRRYLWNHGFRYRLNHKRLPGHPDIVLRKYRTCIFVNGCFWHGHHTKFAEGESLLVQESSPCCRIPKTNQDFWISKIKRNQERDTEELQKLSQMGWHTITVWECELQLKTCEKTLESLAYTLNHIYLKDHEYHYGNEIEISMDHQMAAEP